MPAQRDHQELSPDEIRAELSRVLESADFVASRQLCLFLRYVVEESLAGRADSIKQRNVAVRALERDASYDPRTDPIVRLVAGRLRRALQAYYEGDGARNPVRIEVPKGAYRPRFARAEAAQSAAPSLIGPAGRAKPTDLRGTRRPIIIVSPFIAFSCGNDERYLADSIAQDISVQLSRFSWFEVADFLTARNLSNKNPVPIEIASRFHADFCLGGTIHKQGGLLRLTVQLTHADSGRIIWAERFTLRTDDEQLRQQNDIVDRVAARIGDVYGVLATSVLSLARRKPSEQVTLCEAVLANLRYQLHLADGMFANALQNAELAIAADPEFAWGWAVLALLHMDNFLFDIDHRASDSAESALYCIRQALRADAECGLAHFSQGIYHLTRGEVEQCTTAAERTAEFAHGSPFETAGAAGLLAMVGEHEQSQPLMDWAIHNNPGLPGWVHWASTVNYLKQGQHRQALAATQRYSLPECFWDHLFRAAAQFIAGDEGQAKSSMTRAEQLRPRLMDQRCEMVNRLVPQPDLRNVLVHELPRL